MGAVPPQRGPFSSPPVAGGSGRPPVSSIPPSSSSPSSSSMSPGRAGAGASGARPSPPARPCPYAGRAPGDLHSMRTRRTQLGLLRGAAHQPPSTMHRCRPLTPLRAGVQPGHGGLASPRTPVQAQNMASSSSSSASSRSSYMSTSSSGSRGSGLARGFLHSPRQAPAAAAGARQPPVVTQGTGAGGGASGTSSSGHLSATGVGASSQSAGAGQGGDSSRSGDAGDTRGAGSGDAGSGGDKAGDGRAGGGPPGGGASSSASDAGTNQEEIRKLQASLQHAGWLMDGLDVKAVRPDTQDVLNQLQGKGAAWCLCCCFTNASEIRGRARPCQVLTACNIPAQLTAFMQHHASSSCW
jgi:hypothetical protein